MAMETVCPEISVTTTMSPRISFSHDFCQTEAIPVEKRPPNSRSNSSGLNSSLDFDFCIHECFDQESSSADEIFSDGKILPLDIKKKPEDHHQSPIQIDQSSSPHPPLPESQSLDNNTSKCLKKDRSKEIAEEKQSSKSFWRFKRSSSCGSGYSHSLCPLPLLSRSNSTGSTPNIKRTQNSNKNGTKNSSMSYQKPPLKKVHGSYGNGVQVNPILNVHSGNLFGLGSMFSSGKDKGKKK